MYVCMYVCMSICPNVSVGGLGSKLVCLVCFAFFDVHSHLLLCTGAVVLPLFDRSNCHRIANFNVKNCHFARGVGHFRASCHDSPCLQSCQLQRLWPTSPFDFCAQARHFWHKPQVFTTFRKIVQNHFPCAQKRAAAKLLKTSSF